jgi:peptidyl-tRNA hydrolase, PTH1 family
VWRNRKSRNRRSEGRPALLVFGLGNPGRRYAGTFHNAGHAAVDRLAESLGVRLRAAGEAEYGFGRLSEVELLLGKPRTYMNQSGLAVATLYRRYAEGPENLVVVHDDLDLPLGTVRLKRGGGTGGHKGLLSLAEELGTTGFSRIRIGIGRPPDGVDPADYVLTRVPEESRERFDEGIAAAAEAVCEIVKEGFDRAMTRRNARRPDPLP